MLAWLRGGGRRYGQLQASYHDGGRWDGLDLGGELGAGTGKSAVEVEGR